MTRRHFEFACEGETLAGTLDEANGSTGLLIVSGGSEIRCGAFGGQAELAARVAARGHPVFRFDRRGVGDSTGEDRGFRGSGPDIAAALATFREQASVTRVVAFGNCDAASALMLAEGAGCDALILANPWTFDDDNGLPAPAAVRARYAAKLANPSELLRFAKGGVSLQKLVGGLAQALRPSGPPSGLASEIAAGLARFAGPARLLVAERDRTGQAFLESWQSGDPRLSRCPGASHAFAEEDARQWLLDQLLDALSG